MTPDKEITAGNTKQRKEQTIIPQAETNTGAPMVCADTDHHGQNSEVQQENGNKENLPSGDDFNGVEKSEKSTPTEPVEGDSIKQDTTPT